MTWTPQLRGHGTTHRIHGTCLFTYIWLKFIVNVFVNLPYVDPLGNNFFETFIPKLPKHGIIFQWTHHVSSLSRSSKGKSHWQKMKNTYIFVFKTSGVHCSLMMPPNCRGRFQQRFSKQKSVQPFLLGRSFFGGYPPQNQHIPWK